MDLPEYFRRNGWTIVRDQTSPAVPPTFVQPESLGLSPLSHRYLKQFTSGIYSHQAAAVRQVLGGHNVCMATATASGKSLVFYTVGMELLNRTPNGTVLAIYPLKALTDEQEQKWQQAVQYTRVPIEVGRIDGSVAMDHRKRIMRRSSVVIMTPDVIHAWLLSNLGDRGVSNFIANLQLVVIDEAHTYSGVFGTNAAYLFRRLRHLACQRGANPRFIAASATIEDPAGHLLKLTGHQFSVVGSDADSSGRKARRVLMVEPPTDQDILTCLTDLMSYVTNSTEHRFITFVDSRKQTEQLASVMRRTKDTGSETESLDLGQYERMNVWPYRAGYESHDRKRIEDNLRRGQIRGVISTSALELGIDLPNLTLGILYGLSNSATNYYQRIGRVGRHTDGTIIIVNNGSVLSNRVFRNPDELDRLPLTESTLYLDNRHIQYIHAMCLARPGGEHEVFGNGGSESGEIAFKANFPESFTTLCNQERIGEIEPEFQAMKGQAGNNPNYTYPLRDCEMQFQVTLGPDHGEQRLGTLSFSQLMREAYPGAIYYYQATPYRVWRIKMRDHHVLVRPEKRYTTRPNFLPALIFPNLSSGNIYGMLRYGDLTIVESNLQIRERISGFRERRGPNESSYNYPLDPGLGYFFDQPQFTRNYFSSGVLIMHPALNHDSVERELLHALLFEAFLMQVPFERQDINSGTDNIRADREVFKAGDRFLCIFDQTYGSLRLSSRMMDPVVIRGTLSKAVDIASHDSAFQLRAESRAVLHKLLEEIGNEPVSQSLSTAEEHTNANYVQVIKPGSRGLSLEHNNEEFYVEDVIYTPTGLRYKGRRQQHNGHQFDGVMITMPAQAIRPIPDVSVIAYYSLETAEIMDTVPTAPAASEGEYNEFTFN